MDITIGAILVAVIFGGIIVLIQFHRTDSEIEKQGEDLWNIKEQYRKDSERFANRIDKLELRIPKPPKEKKLIVDSIDGVRVFSGVHTAEQFETKLIIRNAEKETVAEFAMWQSWRYE